MKAEPHVHDLVVADRSYGTRVTYGDQSKEVSNWPFLYAFRLKRARRIVIRRHDRGSVQAGKRQAEIDAAIAAPKSKWGSKHDHS